MTVTPINPLAQAYVQPQGEFLNGGVGARSVGPSLNQRAAEPVDSLQISQAGRDQAKAQDAPAAPLPAFGRFQLGAREPLAFGPDLNASALNRIPGDGVQAAPNGVQFGHQPARGLNILA